LTWYSWMIKNIRQIHLRVIDALTVIRYCQKNSSTSSLKSFVLCWFSVTMETAVVPKIIFVFPYCLQAIFYVLSKHAVNKNHWLFRPHAKSLFLWTIPVRHSLRPCVFGFATIRICSWCCMKTIPFVLVCYLKTISPIVNSRLQYKGKHSLVYHWGCWPHAKVLVF